MGIEDNSEHQQLDVFDTLPDALVFEIFNRVEDAKSLSACAVLCKRFGHLVAQTHNVSLEITPRNTRPELTSGSSWDMNKSKGFVGRFVLKPIHALFHRIVSRKSKTCSNCCDDDEDNMFRLPNDLLKSFMEIRSLSVKLPGHDGDISPENSSGALLKWKAEFGKELESCVILGATGFHKSEPKPKTDVEPIPPVSASAHLTNKQLKKRVIWTISCLIASSARHHMLKQIISSNQTIRDVKIIDGSKQGNIQMTEKQVVELRSTMVGSLIGPEFQL
ncbi:F-box protein At4g18380-like [Bidens hawaiensis]|uniref:F-box protein At4g18380-like n=1 Tax=Bidens hawaiensis TaxID=980011 RepID=UPI00404B15E1